MEEEIIPNGTVVILKEESGMSGQVGKVVSYDSITQIYVISQIGRKSLISIGRMFVEPLF